MIKRMLRALFDWVHSGDAPQLVSAFPYRDEEPEGFSLNYRNVSNGAVITISYFSSRKGQHFTTTRVVTADANPHDEIAAIIAEMRLLK